MGISGEQGTGQQAVADTHNAAVFAGIAAVIFYMTVCARGEETAEAVLVPFQNFREARTIEITMFAMASAIGINRSG